MIVKRQVGLDRCSECSCRCVLGVPAPTNYSRCTRSWGRTRAAMIYQHATRDRDQAIAKALGGLVQQVRFTTAIRPEEASGDE